MALTQSFLDDPIESSAQTEAQSTGLFDDVARKKFLSEIESDRAKKRILHLTSPEKFHPLNLFPLLNDCRLIPRAIQSGTEKTEMDERVFFVPSNEPIASPDDGVVASAGWDPNLGLSVRLLLANGVECTISSLGRVNVLPGDIVRRGQTIAQTTPSGGEASSHLKIKISVNGLAIDPLIAMIR